MNARRILALSLSIAALVAGAGCGGAMAPAKTAAPTTVGEAQSELDRAEADLGRVLGSAPAGGFGAYGQPAAPAAPPAAAEAPPPPPAPEAQAPVTMSAPEQASEAEEQDRAATDPCAVACKALASMERAATYLCDLAGDTDARCTNARARVHGAGERVHAACPACSE